MRRERGHRLHRVTGTLVIVTLAVVLLATQAGAQQTLTVYWRGTQELADGLQAIVDEWGKERGVQVEVMRTGLSWDEYYERFTVMAATGVTFDVALIDMQAIPQGHAGIFIDLTEFIERDGLHEQVAPIALDAYRVHGTIYGFPFSIFPELMYYRPLILDAMGLAYPTDDWTADEWTIDDFTQYAQLMTQDTNGDGVIDQWGYDTSRGTEWVTYAYGAQWIDPATGTFNTNDPTLVASLEHRRRLQYEMHISPRDGDADHLGLSWLPFMGQRIGLVNAGIWMTDRLFEEGTGNWGIAALPKVETRASMTTIDAMGIGRTSENKELAWDLIKYLTTDPEGSVAFAQAAVRGIPTGGWGQRDYLEKLVGINPRVNPTTILQALDYGAIDVFRLTLTFKELEQLRADTVYAALNGEMPLATALIELKRLGDPLLLAGK